MSPHKGGPGFWLRHRRPDSSGWCALGIEPVAAVVFQSVGPGAWQGKTKRKVTWRAGLGDSSPPGDLRRVLLATRLNMHRPPSRQISASGPGLDDLVPAKSVWVAVECHTISSRGILRLGRTKARHLE